MYQVLSTSLPDGVNSEKKETYLSDAEFATIFKMSKAEFAALPLWKREMKKKAAKLF